MNIYMHIYIYAYIYIGPPQSSEYRGLAYHYTASLYIYKSDRSSPVNQA